MKTKDVIEEQAKELEMLFLDNGNTIRFIYRDPSGEIINSRYAKAEDIQRAFRSFSKRIIESVVVDLKDVAMDIIEPCEPDCTPGRHALHDVSWRAHLRVEKYANELLTMTKEGGK